MLTWASTIELAITWNALSLIFSGFWSSCVCYWTDWSLREDWRKYLKMQSRTFSSIDLVVDVLLISFASVLLKYWKNERHSVLEREGGSHLYATVALDTTFVDEDASLVWCHGQNARVALDSFRHGRRLQCRSPKCHRSAQSELEICAVYLGCWKGL